MLNILLSITQESKHSFSTAVSPATKHSGSILFQFFKCHVSVQYKRKTLRDLQTKHLYYKLLQSQGQSYIVNMIGYHSTLHLSGQELTARLCLYFDKLSLKPCRQYCDVFDLLFVWDNGTLCLVCSSPKYTFLRRTFWFVKQMCNW